MGLEWEIVGEEPAHADDPWQVVDETPAAQHALPAGVQPSAAGAGRGAVAEQPGEREAYQRQQAMARRDGVTADYSRVFGGQPMTPPPATMDQLIDLANAQSADAGPSEADLVEQSKAPAARERDWRAMLADARAANAPVATSDTGEPTDTSMAGRIVSGLKSGAAAPGRQLWELATAGAELTGMDSAAEFARASAQAGQEFTRQAEGENAHSVVTGTVSGIVQMLPLLAGETTGLRVMAAGAGADAYQQARDAGEDPLQALTRGSFFATANLLSMKLQVPGLEHTFAALAERVPASQLGAVLAESAVRNGVGMEAQTLLNDVYDKLGYGGTRPDMTLAEVANDVVETAKIAGLTTVVMHGAPLVLGAGARARERSRVGPLASEVAGAIDDSVAHTQFTSEGTDGFARAALTPGSVLTDPNAIDPRQTVRTVRPAPKVEDMPARPLTPEEVAGLAEQARAQAQEVMPAPPESAPAWEVAAEEPAIDEGSRDLIQRFIPAKQPGSRAPAGVVEPNHLSQTPTAPAPAAPTIETNHEHLQRQASAGMWNPEAAPAAGASGPAAGGRAARASLLDQHIERWTREANDAALAGQRAERQGRVEDAQGWFSAAAEKRSLAENVERAGEHASLPAFDHVADFVEQKFGHALVPYVDTSEHAADGFMDPESHTLFVNLANPERSVAFTAFHEVQHVIRQRAGRGDAAAQRATQLLDQVWAMIDPRAKEQYAQRYLFRQPIEAGRMSLEQALQHPLLKDEMLSDFMGKRADDEAFWHDLARKSPQGFGDFVRHWLGVLKGLVQALRGKVSEGGVKDIDKAIFNLDRAKLVAEKVLREWMAAKPQTESTGAREQAENTATDTPASAPVETQTPASPAARRPAGSIEQGLLADRAASSLDPKQVRQSSELAKSTQAEPVHPAESRPDQEAHPGPAADAAGETGASADGQADPTRKPRHAVAAAGRDEPGEPQEVHRAGDGQRPLTTATGSDDGLRAADVMQRRVRALEALAGDDGSLTSAMRRVPQLDIADKKAVLARAQALRKAGLKAKQAGRQAIDERWVEVRQLAAAQPRPSDSSSPAPAGVRRSSRSEDDIAPASIDGVPLRRLPELEGLRVRHEGDEYVVHDGDKVLATGRTPLGAVLDFLDEAEAGSYTPSSVRTFAEAKRVLVAELGEDWLDIETRYRYRQPDDYIRLAQQVLEGERIPERGSKELMAGDPARTNTPAFKRWFGRSVIVTPAGDPAVYFHGTARDIEAFVAKRAGLIFASPQPDIAYGFARSSEEWGIRNASKLLPRDQLARLTEPFPRHRDARVRGNRELREAAVLDAMPSRANVVPVFVRAERPFDYEKPEDVQALTKALHLDAKSEDVQRIKEGSWDFLEATKVVNAVRKLGYDGMFVHEGGAKNIAVFEPNQVKSAVGNSGAWSRSDDRIQYSKREAPDTAAFNRWFSDSKVVDDDGEPKVMFHGTGADISEFRPKQANAIFVTDEPFFSEAYANTSATWLRRRGLDGAANVMPVYVKATHPFDFAEPKQVDAVVAKVFSSEGQAGVKGAPTVEIGDAAIPFTRDRLTFALTSGDWEAIESPQVQAAIRGLGHDGFYVDEAGFKNLGVYEPTQLKSATGNDGTYGAGNPDLRYSGRQRFEVRAFGPWSRFVQVAQDRYNRWKQVIDDVRAQGGHVDDSNDFYRAEERYWGQVGGRLESFQHEVGDFVKAVQRDGLTLSNVALYAYAQHAAERNAWIAAKRPGFEAGSGMTDADASAILEEARAGGVDRELQVHAETLRSWAKGTRDLLRDEGLIDQDEHAAWDSMFRHYVPLRGVQEAVERRRTGRGFNVRGDETREAMGRGSQAEHVIEQIIQDRAAAVIRAGKNDVLRSFAKFVLDNPSPNLWEVNAVQSRPVSRLGENGDRVIEDAPKLVDDNHTITLKDGGKEIHILIHDKALLDQLRHADMEANPSFPIAALKWANRNLSHLYTTLSPTFTVLNLARDLGTASFGVVDEIGFMAVPKLFAAMPRALAESWRAEFGKPSADYQLYAALGGKTAFFNLKTIDDQARELQSMVADADRGPFDPRKVARGAFHLVEAINGGIENATRFAAFKVAREAGKSEVQAASIAKNLTVNFNRKGTQSLASAWYLFFNPAMQDVAIGMKRLRNPKVQSAIGVAMLGAAALALRNAAMGDDDDGVAWWDKIPDDVKERNLVIVLPSGSRAGETVPGSHEGRYLKIPLPYFYSWFAVSANQIVDVWRHQLDPKRGRDLLHGAVRAFNGFMSSVMPVQELGRSLSADTKEAAGKSLLLAAVPDALNPVAQNIVNQNSFGRKMRPDGPALVHMPDSEAFFPSQAGTLWQRAAGGLNAATGGSPYTPGWLDLSPASIENLVRSYGGGPAAFGLDLVNALYARQSIARDTLDAKRLPFVKQALGVIDDETDRSVAYQRMDNAEAKIEPLKHAMREGAASDVRELAAQAGGIAGLDDALRTTRQHLAEITRAELQVVKGSRPDAEKYAKLLQLAQQRRKVLQAFNEAYDRAIEAQRKENP